MNGRQLRLVDSVALISIFAIGLAIAVPSLAQLRAKARRDTCSDHFRALGLALHNYASTYATFPPGRIVQPDAKLPQSGVGTATMILPWIDQAALFSAYNFWRPWGNATNKTVRQTRLEFYLCPEDIGVTSTVKQDPTGQPTNVAFALGKSWQTYQKGRQPDGCFGDNSSVRLRDVTDGTANTLMASEQLIDRPRRSGPNLDDGSCSGAAVDPESPEDLTGTRWGTGHVSSGYFNALRTPNDKQLDCFVGESSYGVGFINKVPRSMHDGGVHALMGDGSIRFAQDDIDPSVWLALNTRAGHEVVDSAAVKTVPRSRPRTKQRRKSSVAPAYIPDGPVVSKFLGMTVTMNYKDGAAAHFVAHYQNEYSVRINIEDGVVAGRFPSRPLLLLIEWYKENKDQLMLNWRNASQGREIQSIKPLD